MIKEKYKCASCDSVFESDRGVCFFWRRKQWGTECLECGQALSIVKAIRTKLELVGFWEKQASNFCFYSSLACMFGYLIMMFLPKDERPLGLYVFCGLAWAGVMAGTMWKGKIIKKAKKRQGIDDLIIYQTKVLESPAND